MRSILPLSVGLDAENMQDHVKSPSLWRNRWQTGDVFIGSRIFSKSKVVLYCIALYCISQYSDAFMSVLR